jgi:hypothetical protein
MSTIDALTPNNCARTKRESHTVLVRPATAPTTMSRIADPRTSRVIAALGAERHANLISRAAGDEKRHHAVHPTMATKNAISRRPRLRAASRTSAYCVNTSVDELEPGAQARIDRPGPGAAAARSGPSRRRLTLAPIRVAGGAHR